MNKYKNNIEFINSEKKPDITDEEINNIKKNKENIKIIDKNENNKINKKPKKSINKELIEKETKMDELNKKTEDTLFNKDKDKENNHQKDIIKEICKDNNEKIDINQKESKLKEKNINEKKEIGLNNMKNVKQKKIVINNKETKE